MTEYLPSSTNRRPITYVNVLADLKPSGFEDYADMDEICRPPLEAKKGEIIEVVDRYSNTIWIGSVKDRQGAFRIDETVVSPVYHRNRS